MPPAVTVFFETFRLTMRKSPSFLLLLAASAAGATTSARMAPNSTARIGTGMRGSVTSFSSRERRASGFSHAIISVVSARATELSSAVEDYAKAIFALQQELEGAGGVVTTTAVAERLGVTAASASGMVRRLHEHGLVEHVPYKGVELTAEGRRVALRVLRHHRLLETYLAQSLGVPWDRVHDEAEVLEHALSDDLEALIAAKLGHPTHDPHGDPIPSAELVLDERPNECLAALEAGVCGVLSRVSDAEPEMLRYLAARGIAPGARFEVLERQPFDGPLFVRFGDEVHVLRRRAGARDERGARGVNPPPALETVPRLPGHDAPELTALRRVRARGRYRGRLALLGPAFVAAVAYIDPGNFATNIAGGAKYGYLLVWVIVAANLMAMLVQYLSAKTGIATGRNLPELCREHFPRPVTWGLWVQAEAIAIATDLAEFVGAAIALNLLFGVPPFAAGLITAVVAFAILGLQAKGYRRFELAIAGFLGIVCLGFLYDLSFTGVDGSAFAAGLIPGFDGTDSILLAVGILGATVMPHVVYLHSALTSDRIPTEGAAEKRELLRFQRVDVLAAMSIAGFINMTMLVVAAELFHNSGHTGVDTIEGAHAGIETLIGGGAALAFAVALLASGLSSSSVGTFAGQVVMQGFIARRINLFLRRAITMAPALVVLALGLDPSSTLVISQVVLSFGIPFALVPMILLTRRADVMGALVNRRGTTVLAAVVAGLIISLNVFLLYETFFG